MIEKISKLILKKITKDTIVEEDRKEILLFGITRIIEDIPKAIGIIIVGVLLKIMMEVGIVTLILILYKTFVGGLHLKTNITCFIYSLTFYLISIYSARYIDFGMQGNTYIYSLMFVFAIYVIKRYVPADVIEIPKVNYVLRKKLKIEALISIVCIYIIAIFLIKNTEIKSLVIYSAFYINLMTTRVMYNLFNVKYGFENYVPEEIDGGIKL